MSDLSPERRQQAMTRMAENVNPLTTEGHDRDCARAIWSQANLGDKLDAIQVEHLLRIGYSAGSKQGMSVAEYLLRKVAEYWDGRPLTHHGDHIHADLMDVIRALTPRATEDA